MASSTNRTITLTIDAQTAGEEDIKDLATLVEKLGKKGGDARPEFEALADELEQLAKQRGVIDTFNDLTASVAASRTAIETSKNSVSEETAKLTALKTALDAARVAEDAYAANMRTANTARNESNQSLLQARSALSAYVASIGGAKRANEEQKQTIRELQQAIREAKSAYDAAKVSVAALSPEYVKLQSASRDAARAVKEQQAALDAAKASAAGAQDEYDGVNEKLTTLSTKAQKVGVDLANVAQEQNRVTQAVARGQNAFDTLRTRLEQTGNAAQTSAQKIEAAFAGTGVRSVNAAEAEIRKINIALQRLAADTSVLDDEFNRAFAQGRNRIAELEREMAKANQTTKGFGASFGDAFRQFGPASVVFNAVTLGINALVGAASRIPQVTAEFQTLTRTLTILTGSSTAAAKEFEYIKSVSNRVGADITDLGKAYAKLAAATKDTNINSAQTKQIFEAVAGSMGALGASSADTENALMAVTQMVSKGVVSMEEMRQQLSERLPGAFQATAKELGITTAELTELISTGKLAASDMLPALARGLEKMYQSGQQNDTLVGKWRQFTNAVKETGNAIGDSGVVDGLLKVARVGTATVTVLADGFLEVGKSAGRLAAGLRTGDLKGALEEIKQGFKDVDERAGKIAGRAQETKKSISELAQDAAKAGHAFVTLADGTRLATGDILKANDGFIAFLVQSTKAQQSAETMATSYRKAAEFTRAAGEASITAANALGDEIDKRNTATRVAKDNAAALDKLTQAEKNVLAVMEAEAAKRAEAIRDGQAASDAHVKQLNDLGDEIAKRRAVVDGLEKQAAANRLTAEALQIEALTLKDNSDRKQELKAVNEEFVRVLAIVRAEVDAGRLSEEQYNLILNESRKQKALYVDAVKDEGEKIKANGLVKQANLSLEAASLQGAIQRNNIMAQTYRLMGDEWNAFQASNKARRLEIELTEIQIKQKQVDAEATLARIAIDREALRIKGLLTEDKAKELEAAELGARAKLKEAEVMREAVRASKELADATERYGSTAGEASKGADTFSSSIDGIGSSADSAASKLRNLQNAQRGLGRGLGGEFSVDQLKAAGFSASEISNYLSNKGTTPEERAAGIVKRQTVTDSIDWRAEATKRGMTAQQADLVSQYVGDFLTQELDKVRQSYVASGVTSADPTSYRMEVAGAMERAFQRAQSAAITQSYQKDKNAGSSSEPSSTRTVNLNLNFGGRSTKVNVASEADARAMEDFFKQLESASLRTY